MMMKFSNRLHLLGSFESLGVIDNEKQMFIFLGKQASQHVQSDMLHYGRFIPVASPQEFAVIGTMGSVSQRFDEPVNCTAMTNADRQYHRPEIAINVFGNLFFDRPEKTLQFFGNSADSNHTASILISTGYQDTYRHKRLFLFDNRYHQNSLNRSV